MRNRADVSFLPPPSLGLVRLRRVEKLRRGSLRLGYNKSFPVHPAVVGRFSDATGCQSSFLRVLFAIANQFS